MMDKLTETFARLDEWRHLPAYQLERRADIFFALYLREVVEAKTGVELCPVIIPELPIKRDLIWPDKPSGQSVKVDYALFSSAGDQVIFVELKTDQGSRRGPQDEYLERAEALGFGAIVTGIVGVAQRTKAYRKYHHLLARLADLGFIELPNDIEAHLYPTSRPGLGDRLRAIRVLGRDPKLSVLYIQPREDGKPNVIGFDTFARAVQQHDDPLSAVFAEYLLRWQHEAAADPPRRDRTYSVAGSR